MDCPKDTPAVQDTPPVERGPSREKKQGGVDCILLARISEITERLNHELRPDAAYTATEIVARLKSMSEQVAQLPDGRWMLKRLML